MKRYGSKNLHYVLPAFFSFLILSIFALHSIQRVIPDFAYSQQPVDPELLTGQYDPSSVGEFYGQKVVSNQIAEIPHPDTSVLGASTDKTIQIDLTNQRLYAFEGGNKVYDFLISSGKWGKTPTGTFRIWIKLRYTNMKGGNPAIGTYYNLPNVPFTMFFANADVPQSKGYGIHGTYWHKNFGHPMSHGCINMKTEEAEQLYYWANPALSGGQQSVKATQENQGTPVIIYGTAPNQ